MEYALEEKDQCTHVGKFGRCKYKVANGAVSKCEHHGANSEKAVLEQSALSSYRLSTYKARMDGHLNHPELKNIRGEIALMRMLIETKLNLCEDDFDLVLQSAGLGDLLLKAGTLVTACDKLEKTSGELLDKHALTKFAQSFIDGISVLLSEEQLLAVTEVLVCKLEELQQ